MRTILVAAAMLLAACGSDGDFEIAQEPTTAADDATTDDGADADGGDGATADGADADAPDDTADDDGAETATVTPVPTEVPPTPEPTPEPTEAPPTPTPAGDGLPGEPFDFLVPADGEVVAVVGVRYDDTLEVHAEPGESSPLVGNLPPTADTVEGTGDGRQLPNSIWWRIRYDGIDGWVGSGFMARLGAVNDITSQLVESFGTLPGAETMVDLGEIVAADRASIEPPSRVVISVAPTVGDLGEITMDVVGLGDDSVRGERLHIFASPDESGEGFTVMSVEATVLCARGVTADGLCT